MRIQNDPQTTNPNTTNFKSIKSVKLRGLYEKAPELGKDLVDTFQKNPKAMNFCKKYDVDIVFYAGKQAMGAVESSVHIFYDNPAVNKVKKFFKSLNGNEDKVSISAWNNAYTVEKSLVDSTNTLKEKIMPYSPGLNRSGLLDSHIDFAEKKIDKAIAQKLAKKEQKAAATEAKNKAQRNLSENSQKLEDSIQNLIDSSK